MEDYEAVNCCYHEQEKSESSAEAALCVQRASLIKRNKDLFQQSSIKAGLSVKLKSFVLSTASLKMLKSELPWRIMR